jgi:hypothetical protein
VAALAQRYNVVINGSWHDSTGFHFVSRDMTKRHGGDPGGPWLTGAAGAPYETRCPFPSAITPPFDTV